MGHRRSCLQSQTKQSNQPRIKWRFKPESRFRWIPDNKSAEFFIVEKRNGKNNADDTMIGYNEAMARATRTKDGSQ